MPRERMMSMRGRMGRMEPMRSRRMRRMPMEYDYARGDRDSARGGDRDYRDYADREQYDRADNPDMRMGYDYNSGDRMDGANYYPIEVMGRFDGYYGRGQHDFNIANRDYGMDYARGGRRGDRMDRDYHYDIPRRYRDSMYDDYGMDYAGDYGETLNKHEHEKWNKKMTRDMEEREKQFFSKENISQKAKQMSIPMEHFNEDELATASTLAYSTYCTALKPYVGSNMDAYLAMGKAFLTDKNASVKGGEKLAVYYDSIVEGEDD